MGKPDNARSCERCGKPATEWILMSSRVKKATVWPVCDSCLSALREMWKKFFKGEQ